MSGLDVAARIRRPEVAPIRSVWPGEASDFTPWLAAHLDFLDVLGLGPLSLEAVEQQIPGTWRSLDILVKTADERLVAIENQFGTVDHDHLTRGLAYAAGLNTAALVVIAERHLPEFVAVADYLNRAAESLGHEDGGIGVYLVEVAVERLEDWYIPRFTVLTSPNSWIEAVKVTQREGNLESVDAFFPLLPEARRGPTRDIVDLWMALPGAQIGHNARRAIALRLPKLAGSGTVAIFTLYAEGGAWLNRGYIAESLGDLRSDEWQSRVDGEIRSRFPTAVWRDKEYYLSIAEPEAAALEAFGRWLLNERSRFAAQEPSIDG